MKPLPASRHRASLFLALIGAQALHSLEEFLTRLYDVFAPARFISGLLTQNLAAGFAVFNLALVGLGLWCYRYRVRPGRAGALGWSWFWVLLELGNGLGHLGLALARGTYFPGAATAPLLVGLAGLLGYRLLREMEGRDGPAPVS